jgi:hypothetical protein
MWTWAQLEHTQKRIKWCVISKGEVIVLNREIREEIALNPESLTKGEARGFADGGE